MTQAVCYGNSPTGTINPAPPGGKIGKSLECGLTHPTCSTTHRTRRARLVDEVRAAQKRDMALARALQAAAVPAGPLAPAHAKAAATFVVARAPKSWPPSCGWARRPRRPRRCVGGGTAILIVIWGGAIVPDLLGGHGMRTGKCENFHGYRGGGAPQTLGSRLFGVCPPPRQRFGDPQLQQPTRTPGAPTWCVPAWRW